jgi:hypothetical protein
MNAVDEPFALEEPSSVLSLSLVNDDVKIMIPI